jgi:hypothetical protein
MINGRAYFYQSGGGSSSSVMTRFSVTSGQSATNLSGESYSGTQYTSIQYSFEIQQGTTIFSNGTFWVQYLNSTWQIVLGETFDNGTTNGVTFSVTQSTTFFQLKAAESGLGNGTIKLQKVFYAT